jgi:hypothetical protein
MRLLLVVFGLWAAAAGGAVAAEAGIAGRWAGRYACAPGAAGGFELVVTDRGGGVVTGVLSLVAPGRAGLGSYTLRGRYQDADRTFQLTPTNWAAPPEGVKPVGLRGRLRGDDALAGHVTGCKGAFTADRLPPLPGTPASDPGASEAIMRLGGGAAGAGGR